MISSIGLVVSWLCLLNLLILVVSNNKFRIQLSIRLNLLLNFLLFCFLEIALFIDDFSISYVANYSAKSTPPVYKFASLWGSLDGSILLWNLVLGAYFLIYIKYYKKTSNNTDIKIFTTIIIFFTSYTIFSSSPFAGCIELASLGCQSSSLLPFQDLVSSLEGRGPNPLLQNHPLMAIHPPILYFGYIGLVLPFVITTSYFFRKDTSSNWVQLASDSTFYPWLFLTAGITLGAAWSYEVLGWGGYWAWDPVENVSFIPWLLATAFLHSSKTQINESTLLNWNYFLGGLMFLSTIFGTFITRSGVLISVHAFSNGNIGVFLLSGLAFFTLFFVYSGSKNIKYFATSKKIKYIFGKSSFFIANNILLFVSALIVFIGTIYPIFYETLYQRQLTIGRTFFDILIGPILIMLIFLMIFSTKITIKNINYNRWLQNNLTNINSSLILTIFFSYVYQLSYLSILALFGSTMLVITILLNLVQKKKLNQLKGSYWSGQIAHLGIGLFAIGLLLNVSQSYSDEFITSEGSIVTFGSNNYIIEKSYEVRKDEKDVINLPIKSNDKYKNASLNIFRNSSQQAISSPAIFRNLESDTYVTIKFIDESSYKLIFRKNYGILIMWLGLSLSTFSVIPRIRANEK
ncbi:cytochrome c biogenesis protein CcsA [Acidimicrobiaceae bacterium]|nr:cytochrome c biogenesis protein CcsA [Acidimicrobiaceae bacterium]